MEQINSNKKHSNRRKYFSLLAVVLFIAFSGAYAYWSMELEDMISTDDAYVTGNADPISAQVSGSVTVVNHKDTNYVRQGDILVSLDKTDATIALNKAKNNLANIVRQTNKLYLQDKQYSALMNPLMILVKIIKLRWIHILSYDQMVSRKINNQTTRCANSIFYTTLFTNSAPNYT